MTAVIAIAGAVAIMGVCLTRGITFFLSGADDQKQVYAASQSNEWRWLSDMHRYADGKTRMKDTSILLLAFMQRVVRDRKSAQPLVAMCLIATSVAAMLIFVVASHYWSAPIGLLLCMLFLTCSWPYQIALAGGYQCVALVFLLAAVWCFQQAAQGSAGVSAAWYVIAGFALGFMVFSSASARKFLPLALGALLHSQRASIQPIWLAMRHGGGLLKGNALTVTAVIGLFACMLLIGIVWCQHLARRLVVVAYHERAPRWLAAALHARHRLSLAYYQARATRAARAAQRWGLMVLGYLVVCVMLSRAVAFYAAQLLVFVGMGTVGWLFTAPDIIQQLKGYLAYADIPRTTCHFRLYVDSFARRGISISPQMRGAGLPWLGRFFWRMVPFHWAWFLASVGLLVSLAVLHRWPVSELWTLAGMVLLSCSPIVVGELTGSPQFARPYFPALAGFLLLIGYATFQVTAALPTTAARTIGWSVVSVAALASAVWNSVMLATDIWPARLAAARVARALSRLGVGEFSTYKTPYNDALVNVLRPLEQPRPAVRFIRSLGDLNEGYVVVPGTSAKAVDMESQACAIHEGDFAADPVLNALLESRTISRYAVASLKTLGSSRFWVHDSEVTSYRELILREIGERDRWRAQAWIVDAGALAAQRSAQTCTAPIVAQVVR